LNFVAGGSSFASLPPQFAHMIKEKQNTVISAMLVIYHPFFTVLLVSQHFVSDK
jgi:hypothetical protein